MAKQGKRITKAYEGIDPLKSYPVRDAVKMVKGRAAVQFDETIEVAITLGVDPRHAVHAVRGMVSLPSGTGKKVRAAVFANRDNAKAAQAAGADISLAHDLAEWVNSVHRELYRP